MTDLSRAQYPVEFFTIKVHNYKDDSHGEDATLHGLFTDRVEAEQVAKTLVPDEYNGFLSASVEPLHFATIGQVAQEQNIGWVPDNVPTAAQIAESGRIEQDADVVFSVTHTTDEAPDIRLTRTTSLGSYSNPTPESIAAEVAGEAQVMEEIRAEGEASERPGLDDAQIEGLPEGSSYNDGYEGESR